MPTQNTKRGKVIKKSGSKTIKVKVLKRQRHSLYEKVVNLTNIFLVHDENEAANIGDVVNFIQCRPISLKKKYRLVSIEKGVSE